MKKIIKYILNEFKESLRILIMSSIGGFFAIIIVISMIYFLAGEIDSIDDTLIYDTARRFYYDKKIESASSENYTIMLSKLCGLRDSDYGKIMCVHSFYFPLHNYESQGKKINSVEYTLTNSSDCKNAVIFYCSVFKNMNLTCKPTLVTNHTFAVVDFEEGYCNIDQRAIDCTIY